MCLSDGLQVLGGPQPGLGSADRGVRRPWGRTRSPVVAGSSLRSRGGAAPGQQPRKPAERCSPPPARRRVQLGLTAGTRAHSGLLSFFPDASLSGRCSPPAPRFCPVQSGAGTRRKGSFEGPAFSKRNRIAKISVLPKMTVITWTH